MIDRIRLAPPLAAILCAISCAVLGATVSFAQSIKLASVKRGNVSVLTIANSSPAPYQVIVSLTKAENISADRTFPAKFVVPRFSVLDAVTIRAGNPRSGHSYSFQSTYRLGDPAARHDASATYRLPFENGRVFTIGQAWGGTLTTHNSPGSRYAVDIPMPTGTIVVAARSGIVAEVVRPHDNRGAQRPEFLAKSNFVRIFHQDGTWAEYAHLLNFSSTVVAGQWINVGTPIGLSGNSGFSSGPHLHFVVQRNDGTQALSVPFKFSNRVLGVFQPKFGLTAAADYGNPRTYRIEKRNSSPTNTAPKSIRECTGSKKEIDNEVIRCMTGAR